MLLLLGKMCHLFSRFINIIFLDYVSEYLEETFPIFIQMKSVLFALLLCGFRFKVNVSKILLFSVRLEYVLKTVIK